MKKTIMLITLLIILLISCEAKTGPIVAEGTPTAALKSVGPVLGESYLWITITPGENSTVVIQFGSATAPNTTVGETITFDTNIQDISPAKDENNSSYAFQTGTITGSLEILDTKRAKISFTQNVTPYVKIMEAVCETPITAP